MFGYNPTVNDRSGEISAAGQLAGATGIANGISSAGESISSGLLGMAANQSKAADKAKMTQDELDMMGGAMGFMQQHGAVTGTDLDKFNTGSIGTKRGIYTMGQLNLNNMFKQANIQMSQAGQAGQGGAGVAGGTAQRGYTTF